MVTVVLTHDVDWFSVKSLRGLRTFFGFVRRELSGGKLSALKVPYWQNFHKWMELENGYDVRSVFYFLYKGVGGSTYNFSDVEDAVKNLDKGGWEIGLHGTFDSTRSLSNLTEEKMLLERTLGKSVQGIRLHYLRISEESLRLQEEAGFRYDSSLETQEFFKIFHPVVRNRKLNLIELPLTLHDSTLFVKKKMAFDDAYKYSRKIIDKASREDGIVTLNWHQRTFSSEFKSWLKTYVLILKYAKSIEAEMLKPIEVVQRFQQNATELTDFLKLER